MRLILCCLCCCLDLMAVEVNTLDLQDLGCNEHQAAAAMTLLTDLPPATRLYSLDVDILLLASVIQRPAEGIILCRPLFITRSDRIIASRFMLDLHLLEADGSVGWQNDTYNLTRDRPGSVMDLFRRLDLRADDAEGRQRCWRLFARLAYHHLGLKIRGRHRRHFDVERVVTAIDKTHFVVHRWLFTVGDDGFIASITPASRDLIQPVVDPTTIAFSDWQGPIPLVDDHEEEVAGMGLLRVLRFSRSDCDRLVLLRPDDGDGDRRWREVYRSPATRVKGNTPFLVSRLMLADERHYRMVLHWGWEGSGHLRRSETWICPRDERQLERFVLESVTSHRRNEATGRYQWLRGEELNQP